MKKWIPLIIIVLLHVQCNSSTTQIKTPPTQIKDETANVQIEEVETVVMEMTIEGMVCAMGCAAVIEKKLNKTNGIAKATVDFATKKALVEFNRKTLNSSEIIDVVESVGKAYTVRTFSITE